MFTRSDNECSLQNCYTHGMSNSIYALIVAKFRTQYYVARDPVYKCTINVGIAVRLTPYIVYDIFFM